MGIYLSANETHGLVAQSVRASERNSVVVGSNPTQANFQHLIQRIPQWWISCIFIYVSIYLYMHIPTCYYYTDIIYNIYISLSLSLHLSLSLYIIYMLHIYIYIWLWSFLINMYVNSLPFHLAIAESLWS